MFVCVYVCVYVCIYVYIFVYIYENNLHGIVVSFTCHIIIIFRYVLKKENPLSIRIHVHIHIHT